MASENVDLVRRGYAAWNRGDPFALEEIDPDFTFYGHDQLPEPGPYRGRDEVERFFAEFREVWGELWAEPVELLDAGDTVVALVRLAGRGRESGAQVQGGVDVHVWTLAGGKIVGMRMYQGGDAAARAGLSDLEREVMRLLLALGLGEPEVARRVGVAEGDLRPIASGALDKMRAFASTSSSS